MCVIVTSPDSKHRPSLATLEACERTNPHGSGVAWVQHNRVQWLKGLSAAAIAELLEVIEGPAVVHFRIASVGGVKAALCHPFPVSPTSPLKPYGQAGTVLFHNGHWSDWRDFAEEHDIKLAGPVSDTRIIAVGVHRLGRKLLRKIPCRFVMFSKRGVERFGDWSEVEGCYFSNLYWQPKPILTPKGQLTFLASPRRIDPGEAMACFAD